MEDAAILETGKIQPMVVKENSVVQSDKEEISNFSLSEIYSGTILRHKYNIRVVTDDPPPPPKKK